MKRGLDDDDGSAAIGVPVALFEAVFWQPTVLAIAGRVWDVRDICALSAVTRRMYFEWTAEPSGRSDALRMAKRWGGGSFACIRERALCALQTRGELRCFECGEYCDRYNVAVRKVFRYATCVNCAARHFGSHFHASSAGQSFKGHIVTEGHNQWLRNCFPRDTAKRKQTRTALRSRTRNNMAFSIYERKNAPGNWRRLFENWKLVDISGIPLE